MVCDSFVLAQWEKMRSPAVGGGTDSTLLKYSVCRGLWSRGFLLKNPGLDKTGNGKVSRRLQSTAKIPLSKVGSPQNPHVEPCSELVTHWGCILPLSICCWDRLQHPACDPHRVKGVKKKKEKIVTYCLQEWRVRGLPRTPKVCLNSWQPSWMSSAAEKEMTPFFCESWDAASHRGSGSPRNAADSEERRLKCSKIQTALSHIKGD